MWSDSVTLAELEGTLDAARQLAAVSWAAPLLARTKLVLDRAGLVMTDPATYRADPISPAEKSLLFEIRFARDLANSCTSATYEFSAGVGDSTVDFRVDGEMPWLVELVSLHESDAFKAASWQNGLNMGYLLQTGAEDPRQSGEGEILKAQQRIAAKTFDGTKPIKFPKPSGALHMIVVDARGFMGDGHGDGLDWSHIVYGPNAGPRELTPVWRNPVTSETNPILGLFDPQCPQRGAATLQERIHSIAFVCEKTYLEGEIWNAAHYRGNPNLFVDEQAARAGMKSWPLLPSNEPQFLQPTERST